MIRSKTLQPAHHTIKINEGINNQKGAARALNAIGLIYFSQKNYNGALKKYEQSLAIREQISDEQGVAGSLNNIGEVYKTQGNSSKAFEYFEAALKVNRKTGNRNWESINLNNMAQVYQYEAGKLAVTDHWREQNYNEAILKYTQALNIRKAIGDRQGMAWSGIGLGEMYTLLGDFKKASVYLNEALAIAKNIGYREAVREVHLAQMRLDSLQGNWNAAFHHHLLYIRYRDSLGNEEITRRSVSAEMNFEFEKKEHAARLEQEKKDALAAGEKHRQNIIIVSVSVILAIVLVLALVIYRSLRQNQEKNRIITAQKELVEQQKHLVDEKQREITDSINYAERIQRSFLASDRLLSQNLKEYFVFYEPKDIVSGDFYWAAELDNGCFLLATADSTGHGVPGAIMSILNITCLEKSVEEKKLKEPVEILDHTRTGIIERLKKDGSDQGGKDGMDCSLLCFEKDRQAFTYAAAHNPVWIVRFTGDTPQLIELAADKMPVGKHDRDKIAFTQHHVETQPGDMVYTLTDGMPDQFGGPSGKKFMYKSLKNLLLSVAHLPAREQK